ncbi:restriction endonuclease subunit S [uncultured Ruminococcus sp.]|uniref:restriction endonuclease subunit S n=1 Tax=uncultured Ruminococcus sp. TaxID=165186 RepID=UPI0025CD58A1|nr:restriction endonuclease subunit S [uncultured Ruminococcus sp.]
MIDTKAIRAQILRLAFSAQLTTHHDGDDDITALLSSINPKKNIEQTEDIPYKIPDYWKWVKLSDLYEINPKVEADNNADAAFIPMEKISAGFERTFSFEVMNWEKAAKNHTKFQNGDVAFAKISPCFENRKSFVAENLPNSIGGGTTELIVLRQKYVYPLFTYYLVNDQRFIKAGSGSYKGIVGQQRVKSDIIKNYLIPLPPLAEQKRIVERVEEIFRVLDTIDEAQEKYSADVESLRSKLITAGIQGRLTQQLDTDGTAEELYQQIQAEKQKLIKEGKLKKEKPLPPISPEEIPFEIPGNWKWVRMKEISFKITDGTHHSPINTDSGDYMYVTAKNIKDKGVDLSNITYVSKEVHDEIYARCNPELNDVLLIKDGATTGVVTVNDIDEPFSLLSSVALIKPVHEFVEPWYIAYVLRSSLFYKTIRAQMTGTGITRIVLRQIEPFIVPLPPLAEQKRIADVLEKALGAIDKG